VLFEGPAEQIERFDRVLAHEFVHAVVAMLGGRNVPVWLNEATLFEPGGARGPSRFSRARADAPP